MSAFGTDKWGDTLISGILSGQKFRQFQEDAKNTALQRKLLEQQYSHNAVMEPLLMAHQNAATRAEQSRLDGYAIANQLAKATFDDTVAEKKATRLGAEADSRVSTATETSRISSADSKARAERTRAGQETLVGLQGLIGSLKGAHSFSAADVGALAKQLGIIGTSEADAGVMLPMYKNMLDQSVKQYENDKNFVSSKLAEQEAKTRGEIGQAIQHEVLGGRGISDLFSQAEPEIAGPLIAKLDAGQNLSPADYAKLAVSSDRRRTLAGANGTTTITESPMDKTEQTKLGELLVDLREKLFTAQRTKKELEAGRAPKSSSWFSTDATDRKNELAQTNATISELEAQIADIRAQGKGVEKTTTKGNGVSSSKSESYPAAVVDLAKSKGFKLKPGLSKAELDDIVAYLRSK